MQLQPFYLLRHEDVNKISGTGIVGLGVIWPVSGIAMVEWLTVTSSLNQYRNLDHVREVHGHEGRTEIIMGHPPSPKKRKKKSEAKSVLPK